MSAPNSFTLEELKAVNHVIGDIHSSVYEKDSLADLMERFMQNLKNLLYFDKSNFLFLSYNEANHWYEVASFIPHGWAPDDIDRYIETYVHMDDVIPVLTQNEEIAFRGEDIFSLKDRKKTQYYQEFIETSQIQTSIDANVLLPDEFGVKLIAGVFRDPGKLEFSYKDVQIVRICQPHLSSAVSRCMENTAPTSFDQFLNLLENFESLGICIMDECLNILSFNNTYRSFVCQSPKATVADNEVTVKMRQLCDVISKTQGMNKIGPLEVYIKDNSFLIEIVHYEKDKNTPSKYVGLVYSHSDFFLHRMTKLRKEYKLSNREFEILFLILKNGLSNEEVATQLFISESTVKKHIYSAYQKIGINNQKQLLSLLRIM